MVGSVVVRVAGAMAVGFAGVLAAPPSALHSSTIVTLVLNLNEPVDLMAISAWKVTTSKITQCAHPIASTPTFATALPLLVKRTTTVLPSADILSVESRQTVIWQPKMTLFILIPELTLWPPSCRSTWPQGPAAETSG